MEFTRALLFAALLVAMSAAFLFPMVVGRELTVTPVRSAANEPALLEDSWQDDMEHVFGGASRHLLQSISCYKGQIQCPSKIAECFSPSNGCNGQKDCSDGSDEDPNFCANFSCPTRSKCPSNLCSVRDINPRNGRSKLLLCDGIQDCPDNSDEAPSFCASYDCTTIPTAIACPGPTKQCIFLKSSNNSVINGFPLTDASGNLVEGLPSSICDGVKDCFDGSDEDPGLCSSYTCNKGTFKCGNRCISRNKVCDGVIDCPDGGSDEDPNLCGLSYTCSLSGLYSGYGHCPSGVGCYSERNEACNGVFKLGCLDKSDEDPAFCLTFACPDNKIKCPSGVGCLFESSQICNGQIDCLDGSDESPATCANITFCPGLQTVRCPGSGQGGCLNPGRICDGVKDCTDGSDEATSLCTNYTCTGDFSGNGRVQCPSGIGCVDRNSLCDGVAKNGYSFCPDGSDEDPSVCAGKPCPGTGQVRCKNGICVFGNLCNGNIDCADNSDEDPAYCAVAACPTGGFTKCKDGIHCVNTGAQCNGRYDCPDRSDEDPALCSTFDCSSAGTGGAFTEVKCPGASGSGPCVYQTSLCDGVKDCLDGSDESPSFCQSYTCPTGNFKCPGTNVCVSGALCNGRNDCPDGSDESPAVCSSGGGTSSPSTTPATTTGAPSPTTSAPSGTPVSTTGGPSSTTSAPSTTPATTTGGPSPTTSAPSGTPVSTTGGPSPTTSAPSGTPALTPRGPSPTTSAPSGAPASAPGGSTEPCDPKSNLPNQCFNANGSSSVCCPGQCPDVPLDTPTCGPGGPQSTAPCDPTSSLPNQCFNSYGSQSVCCPGKCPVSPGPVASCG